MAQHFSYYTNIVDCQGIKMKYIIERIAEMQNKLPNTATVYAVGGCIRDYLLGKAPKDIDFVVTGMSKQEMDSIGHSTVGQDFPVYIIDGDEVALARVERSTGDGYADFEFDVLNVTIEEDLMRRDLRMNSIAMDVYGNIVDPLDGRTDILNRVLRHNSDKAFKEDPVRVLRVARFAARYTFTIHSDTMLLCKEMVADGMCNLDLGVEEDV